MGFSPCGRLMDKKQAIANKMPHEPAHGIGSWQTVHARTMYPGLMLWMSVVILVCAQSAFCLSDQEWQEVLDSLKEVDSKVADLEKRIREDTVGWWDAEIITAGRTNQFQSEYLALKGRLQPLISGGIQAGRERGASVKTMGQALASLPEMVPLLMSFVDYQGRLDHIEFMIESRRSMILGRLSVWIAILIWSCAFLVLHCSAQMVATIASGRIASVPPRRCLSAYCTDRTRQGEQAAEERE